MNTNERHGIHDSTTLQTAVCTRAFNLSTGSNPVNWFLMRSLNIRCQRRTRWGSYLGIDIIRNQFVSFVHWSMLTNQTNPQLSLRIHGGYTMLRQKGHIWPVTQQDEIPKQRHLTSFNYLTFIFDHFHAQWCYVTHELRCNKDKFTIVCLQGHCHPFFAVCGDKLQSFPRFQFQCAKSFFYPFAHGETVVVSTSDLDSAKASDSLASYEVSIILEIFGIILDHLHMLL